MPRVHLYGNPVTTGAKSFNDDLEISNWSHRISATVGFDVASFEYRSYKYILEDLFANALGCRVVRYSPDGHFIVWEGYVAEMVLSVPGLEMRISLREMANRVAIRYTPTDTSTNPPTNSATTSTAVVNNTASQALYGIKQVTFAPSKIEELRDANASQMATTVLAEYRQPRRSQDIRSGSNDIKLQFLCEGYMNTLGWRVYNQTANSGAQDADLEIGDIITSVGQFIKSTSLTTNPGTDVKKYWANDDTALDIIRSIVALGDGSRWIAQVLENRKFYYKAAATTVGYYRRIIDNRQEFIDVQKRVVPYWELRPDTWVRTVDIYPNNLTPALLQDDYQAAYLESVEWSEPDGLSITGSTGDQLQVTLSRLSNRGDVLL